MHSRQELRNKKRRIIWNNDGDDLQIPARFNTPGMDKDLYFEGYEHFPHRFETVDDYLKQRMKGKIDNTQVDSLFVCGYTSIPNWEFPLDNIGKIGPDPLQHAVKFAHDNRMEFFYSFRMNDIHLSAHRAAWLWSDFRKANIHLLQGKIDREWFEKKFTPWMNGEVEEHPLVPAIESGWKLFFPWEDATPKPTNFRTWAAFDFGLKEVRDYYLGLVREACRRYDLDGIEFDWGRTPPFFRNNGRANAPVMTDFMRQVRKILDDAGQKRGKAILFATRVPDSSGWALSCGLDGPAWMKENLIDLLIAGFGSQPFSFPLGEWVRLGHKHEIPVYGCIENGLPEQGKTEVIRATAQRYWSTGADGIYLYNHFYEDRRDYDLPGYTNNVAAKDTLYDLGDPARLRNLDKIFCVDWYCSPDLPIRFSTESGPSEGSISFEIADDPTSARTVTLQTQWAADVDVSRVSLRLNGETVPAGQSFVMDLETDNQGWYAYKVSSLRNGINTLEIMVQPSDTGPDKFLLKQVRTVIGYGK
jgi:hypothetical protein